ncbi:MAG: hypothetical protein QGH11_12345 [Pirellulaceae bacterium]|nr:hypothetical protein [Pirellulaceae bacterium]
MKRNYSRPGLWILLLVAGSLAVTLPGCSGKDNPDDSNSTVRQNPAEKPSILGNQVLKETTPVALLEKGFEILLSAAETVISEKTAIAAE